MSGKGRGVKNSPKERYVIYELLLYLFVAMLQVSNFKGIRVSGLCHLLMAIGGGGGTATRWVTVFVRFVTGVEISLLNCLSKIKNLTPGLLS